MKFSQITTLILAATCGWSASLTGQNMSQEDFREILEPYVGAWNGEYRIYSQKDELLNRFAVNRTYWWDNDILLSRVVYDFGEQSQTFYHRIVLSEGNPYSFITDELASGSVRSALKGETLRGTLVWTRVLPKESLPVRISERISDREGARFLEFWGDQEARDARGGAMLVRIDGFMTQLSESQDALAGTPASTQPIATAPLTPHQQALRDRQNAETTRQAEQASEPESPPSRAEQRRLAAERRKQDEADRAAAEERRRQEEQQKRDEAKKQREERRAEQARLREEQKAKEAQARKEAEELKAEEVRAKEEAARVEAAKQQEERRLRDEARQAEAQKKKDEEQARIDARKAERERKAAEDAAKREAARKPLVPKTSESAKVVNKSSDSPAPATPVPAPVFNAEIQEALENLKIIGVRDRPGQECIVVEHYLLFKLGEPLNLKHPCSLTKIDATHLHFTDDAGYVYRITRPDLSQQEVPEAHPDEENPQ